MPESNRLPNIHPGEILREEFMVPLRLTAYRIARDTGMPVSRVDSILKGTRGITADSALRLGRYLGTSPQFWLNLQAEYELREARSRMGEPELANIRPLRQSAA